MKENTEIVKIALLVSCACVLQVAETFIPHPVPGVRLGLANLITLVALVTMGFGVSIQIALLRTLIGSLVLGTFLSPSFLLSFSGALVSTLIMGILFKISTRCRRVRFSLIGISVMGSLAHNGTQIGLAYLLLVKNGTIFLLWPWLLISGVIMGFVTGIISIEVCRKLERTPTIGAVRQISPDLTAYPEGRFVDRSSPIHHVSPRLKILGAIVLTATILLSQSTWVFTSALFALLAAASLARIRWIRLLSGIEKLSPILILSFIFPLLFTSGTILLSIGPFEITRQGQELGLSMAFRIVIIYCTASLLSMTTSPRDIAVGLEALLSPLKAVRIPVNDLARTLALAWAYFPVFWAEARSTIREHKFEVRTIKNPIEFSSDLIVGLVQRADQLSKEVHR